MFPRPLASAPLLICLLLLTAGSTGLTSAEPVVRIAARSDTRPFIWRDPQTSHYLGFFWDICTEAVQRTGYQFQEVPINAEERSAFVTEGTGNFDLLCDPTTITLQRMKNFTKAGNGRAPFLAFTPIIFVANGTHVVQRFGENGWGWGQIPERMQESSAMCNALGQRPKDTERQPGTDGTGSGGSSGTTGGDISKPWITFSPRKSSNKANITFEFWGYVKGSTIGDEVELKAEVSSRTTGTGTVICTTALESHQEAAKEFCKGHLSRYFGDADIVRASISAYLAEPGNTCKNNFSVAAGGTYEPYAFVASSLSIPEFPELLSLALYGMFSDGTVDRLFTGHFPDTTKSQHLNTLFGINAIPDGYMKTRTSEKSRQ